MQKQNLTQASRELFRRAPDERFASLDDLWRHCQDYRDRSTDRWHSPAEIRTVPTSSRLDLLLGGGGEPYHLNDWSFSQLCKLAGVSKDTVNKVSSNTAGRVLAETFPQGGKPMQVLTMDRAVRSIHGASYTRLDNLDLLAVVKEFATDFQPPQTGCNGATGLYRGEQDMFVFLIAHFHKPKRLRIYANLSGSGSRGTKLFRKWYMPPLVHGVSAMPRISNAPSRPSRFPKYRDKNGQGRPPDLNRQCVEQERAYFRAPAPRRAAPLFRVRGDEESATSFCQQF